MERVNTLQVTDSRLLSIDRIPLPLLATLAGPLLGLCVWALPLDLEPTVHKTLAITTLVLVYWITEPVAHAVTALVGCFLFWARNVTSFSIAYSGFANPAPWFVFGALLVGQATASTGLAKRLSLIIMVRLGTSYTRLLFGMLSILFLLQFLVPSGNAQIAVLAPVVIHLIHIFGVPSTSNIARGCFLSVVYASVLIGKMFLNSAPPILVRGIIEYQVGLNLMWSQWLIACLPLALITLFTCWMTALWLFPPERRVLPGGSESLHEALQALGPWTTHERKALGWICLAILLWATDFVHHMHPALIALGVGLALTLPNVGVLDTAAFKSVNFLVIIFLAGATSLSNVLIETNTLNFLAVALSQWALPWFSQPLSSVMTIYGGGFLYHLLMPSETPMIATGLPLLLQMTAPFGDNPIAIGILWAMTSGSCLFVSIVNFGSGLFVRILHEPRFAQGGCDSYGAARLLHHFARAILLARHRTRSLMKRVGKESVRWYRGTDLDTRRSVCYCSANATFKISPHTRYSSHAKQTPYSHCRSNCVQRHRDLAGSRRC